MPYCYIDDGSHLEDGSGHIGVKVLLTKQGPGRLCDEPLPQVGQYIALTGISESETINGQPVGVVRHNKGDRAQYRLHNVLTELFLGTD